MKLVRSAARSDAVPKYLAAVRRYWSHRFAVQDDAYVRHYPRINRNEPAFSTFWDAAQSLLTDLRRKGVDIHYLIFLLSTVAWLYELPGSTALPRVADRRRAADCLSNAARVLHDLAPLYCSGEDANQLGERLNGLSSELREGSRRARVVGIHQAASFASPPRGRPKSYGVDEVLSLMHEYLKSCGWKPTWDTIAELSSLAGLSADSDSIRHRVKKYRTQVAAPPTSSNLHWQNHSYRVHIEEFSADLELNQQI